ncbi:MAG: flavodoxin domain-containing protein [Nitriliruptorales bacterium]|nr:flavodoxin domain-containing protein [Nitriliruptorales bacterium]
MRILVAVASGKRGTRFLAEALGDQFASRGLTVDVLEPGEIAGFDDYDAVLVGASLSGGRWRRDARQFVRDHADSLADRPVWLFSSRKAGDRSTVDVQDVNMGSIVRDIGVHEHRVFDVPSERMLRRAKKKPLEGGMNRFDEVAEWAQYILEQLSTHLIWMMGAAEVNLPTPESSNR